MKQTKIIITAALLGTVLFTACTKDNKYDLASNNNMTTGASTARTSATTSGAATNATTNGMALMTYSLTTLPMPATASLQWTAGNMNVRSIIFDAILVTDARSHLDPEAKVGQPVKLFTPQAVGSISLTGGLYEDIMPKIALESAISTPAALPNSFYLTGTFNANGKAIPIQFMVDQPVLLISNFRGSMLLGAQAYTQNLTLDLALITNGISDAMLSNAQATNGTITISSTSNANLYQLMYTNLEHSLLAQTPNNPNIFPAHLPVNNAQSANF